MIFSFFSYIKFFWRWLYKLTMICFSMLPAQEPLINYIIRWRFNTVASTAFLCGDQSISNLSVFLLFYVYYIFNNYVRSYEIRPQKEDKRKDNEMVVILRFLRWNRVLGKWLVFTDLHIFLNRWWQDKQFIYILHSVLGEKSAKRS